MASFCAQALVSELEILVSTLRAESHPSLRRFEPFYKDTYIAEVRNCFQTLSCIRQELGGLQASIQNLTMLVVSQQQQLYHPPTCQHFALHSVNPPLPQLSLDGSAHTRQATRKSRPKKKKNNPGTSLQTAAVPGLSLAAATASAQQDDVLKQIMDDCQIQFFDIPACSN